VLTQTDALNKVTTASYNTSNRSLSVTTPEGVVTSTVRTRHGQTLSITDGNQKTTSYSYDRNGNLLQTTSALNTTDQQSFDRAGRLIETTDANGIKTAYTFDAANRVLTRQVDSAGLKLTTTYTYDAKGQKLSIQDPNLVVTTLSYDLGGRVLTQTLDATGLNLRTLYTYDPQGHTLSVTDPNGTVTQYTYDKLGRRTKEQIDPAGLNLTTQYTYDKNGNVVTKTDANTNVTRYAYDAGDRLIYTVDPAGGVSLNEYDKQGRVVRTTGYATAIDLTGLATPATVTQIQAKVTASAGKDAVQANRYDNDGRLRFTVDGTGAVTEYRYDANGNVVDRIDYASTINLATWNATTDPAPIANVARDLRTRTVYDELNRATYSADGLGAVTQKVYDKVGNVTQVVQYANTVLSTVSPSAVVASVTGTDRSLRLCRSPDEHHQRGRRGHQAGVRRQRQRRQAHRLGWCRGQHHRC
jgi:YD repeat-containing protein